MPPKPTEATRAQIIAAVKDKTTLVALLVVATEALTGIAIAAATDGDRILIYLTFAVLMGLTLLTIYAIERLRSTAFAVNERPAVCRVIESRSDLYLQASALIRVSKRIKDTSWGREPARLTEAETAARSVYRAAAVEAVRQEKEYKELFSVTDVRASYLKEAAELELKHPNYQARVVPADLRELSMIEMLIGDEERIILSHVSAEDTEAIRYLYIESKPIVSLFLRLYKDCWQSARPDREKAVAQLKLLYERAVVAPS